MIRRIEVRPVMRCSYFSFEHEPTCFACRSVERLGVVVRWLRAGGKPVSTFRDRALCNNCA